MKENRPSDRASTPPITGKVQGERHNEVGCDPTEPAADLLFIDLHMPGIDGLLPGKSTAGKSTTEIHSGTSMVLRTTATSPPGKRSISIERTS